MILFTQNKKLDSSLAKKLWKLSGIPRNEEFKTSYADKSKDLRFLRPFYDSLVVEAMEYLNLAKRSNYYYSMWYQCYNKSSTTHGIHDHFEADTLISWVHIVEDAGDKCFYFATGDGEKFCESQKTGDFFVFPSWASHGVKKVETNKDRMIVAGNIGLNRFLTPEAIHDFTPFANLKDQSHTQLHVDVRSIGIK